jgi:hypothetical protein
MRGKVAARRKPTGESWSWMTDEALRQLTSDTPNVEVLQVLYDKMRANRPSCTNDVMTRMFTMLEAATTAGVLPSAGAALPMMAGGPSTGGALGMMAGGAATGGALGMMVGGPSAGAALPMIMAGVMAGGAATGGALPMMAATVDALGATAKRKAAAMASGPSRHRFADATTGQAVAIAGDDDTGGRRSKRKPVPSTKFLNYSTTTP